MTGNYLVVWYVHFTILINAVDRGRKIVRASKNMQILPIFAMYPHVIVVKQRGF